MLEGDRTLRRKALYNQQAYKVAAGAVIHLHAIVVTSQARGGYLFAATGAAGERVVGLATEAVDNRDAQDGDVSCLVYKGGARIPTSEANTLNQTDVGGQAYVLDDEFVVNESGSANNIKAGEVLDVEDGFAWVLIGV